LSLTYSHNCRQHCAGHSTLSQISTVVPLLGILFQISPIIPDLFTPLVTIYARVSAKMASHVPEVQPTPPFLVPPPLCSNSDRLKAQCRAENHKLRWIPLSDHWGAVSCILRTLLSILQSGSTSYSSTALSMYVKNCISVVEADTNSTVSSQFIADALFTSQLLTLSSSALSADEISFKRDSATLSLRACLGRLILQTTIYLRMGATPPLGTFITGGLLLSDTDDPPPLFHDRCPCSPVGPIGQIPHPSSWMDP
jgi:hypothetical protein